MTVPTYFVAAAESGPYTLEQLRRLATQISGPFKVFDSEGHLVGTMYPNGEFKTR